MPKLNLDSLQPGTVTDVSPQVKNPERVSVFIDGEFAFGLSGVVALEAGLKKGKELDVGDQRGLLQKEEVARAKEYVMMLVSRQPRTRAEIERKLREKEYSSDAGDAAIGVLERLGYLDDRAFAEAFVRERHETKGHGPMRLRADMRKKGLDSDFIDAVLSDLDDNALRQSAREHARSRWEALSGEADPRKRLKKTMDYVARRGFSWEVIREVCEGLDER